MIVTGVVTQTLVSPKPLLIWNLTASAPLGLYRRSLGAVERGDWVLVHAPEKAAQLAVERHYLDPNVPLVKRVVALSGDTVCRMRNAIRVNGAVQAVALDHDHQGYVLPHWQGCLRLQDGQMFLLTAPPTSFDSRYFGAVPSANLIERVVPLWTY